MTELLITCCCECPLYDKHGLFPCNHPDMKDWKSGWKGDQYARHTGCPLSVEPLTLVPTEGSMEQ